jgi:hypothetical protein
MNVLLKVSFIDDKGKVASGLFTCEGRMERKKPLITVSEGMPKPLTLEPLPTREKFAFESDDEVLSYLSKAITHLAQDKGYRPVEQSDCDLYFEKESRGLFINLTPRCDKVGLDRAKELIELRGKHGSAYDYGLVVPAFQESLGISLLVQERWYREYGEFLAAHRIGVYAVSNTDPNVIFPFTIYPKEKELARYFMYSSQQWATIRRKYVLEERRREKNRLS